MHHGSGCCSFTQEGLRAVVEDVVLIAEGEDELLHLARLAIEGQHIVTGGACMARNTGRTIEEGADENLPALRPARRAILLANRQGCIKGIEGATAGRGVEEHHTQ